jgi:hypothetical protein
MQDQKHLANLYGPPQPVTGIALLYFTQGIETEMFRLVSQYLNQLRYTAGTRLKSDVFFSHFFIIFNSFFFVGKFLKAQ